MLPATSTLYSTDTNYPTLLRYFDGHPSKLRMLGEAFALEGPFISIIGSRTMSQYGEKVARMLIPGLVHAGLTVVSGLAYGIDAFAHRLALQEGGRCVGVLGSGLQAIYPASNRSLSYQVAQKGCVLSEYDDDVGPQKRFFPERNRIVAGMSPLTLIIEAGEKSGTLITARMALNAGREVCVVPGDITSPLTAGIHILLNEGAKPVRCTKDVLDLYGYPEVAALPPSLTSSQQELYALIPAQGSEIESLLPRMKLSFSQLQSQLSNLELKGLLYFRPPLWLKT